MKSLAPIFIKEGKRSEGFCEPDYFLSMGGYFLKNGMIIITPAAGRDNKKTPAPTGLGDSTLPQKIPPPR